MNGRILKKLLSITLILAMCLTMIPPMTAFAENELDGSAGIVIDGNTVNGTVWTDGSGGTATWEDYNYLVLRNYRVDSGSNPAITFGKVDL